MRLSIFELVQKKPFKEEYLKMIKVLSSKCVSYQNKDYSYFDYVNMFLFHNWKFRGTYLDCYEYLESIGVSIKTKKISKDSFFNFLEFLLNIQLLINNLNHFSSNTKFSIPCKSILIHNIPILLDSYGYQAYSLEDRILILEKDLKYDDLISILPNEILELLFSYRQINNNGIKVKRMILYKIYKYMEKDIDKYKSYSSSLFTTVKTVIMKMGIIGEVDKKYRDLSNYKLRKYYDNCYSIMVYLLDTEAVLKVKEEIKMEGKD